MKLHTLIEHNEKKTVCKALNSYFLHFCIIALWFICLFLVDNILVHHVISTVQTGAQACAWGVLVVSKFMTVQTMCAVPFIFFRMET